MSTLAITRTPDHPASQNPVDFRGLTLDEVIPHLVGHTIDEVERQLILHTLIHCCGSRTRSANILGISIRCMRNKISRIRRPGNCCSRARRASCRATERGVKRTWCRLVPCPLMTRSGHYSMDAGLGTDFPSHRIGESYFAGPAGEDGSSHASGFRCCLSTRRRPYGAGAWVRYRDRIVTLAAQHPTPADTGVDVSLLCPLAASACRQPSVPMPSTIRKNVHRRLV